MTDDLLKRAEPFLNQCASCDYGLPTSCTCPDGDYRPVMLDLVREAERLRAVAEAAHAYVTFPERPELTDPNEAHSWDLEAERRYFTLRDVVIGEKAR